MITAIFNKSKPINLVLAMLLLVFGFVIVSFNSIKFIELNGFLYKIIELCIAIFSVLVVDFIVKKNAISDQNSFVILFFSIFCFSFWSSSENHQIMFSNLFVLLALRKIISLKSQTNTVKKIFDAALCICIASVFHFWAILFFIVLYIGVAIYDSNNYKNWLTPLVSVFVAFSIASGYEMVVNNKLFYFSDITIVRGFQTMSSSLDIAVMVFFSVLLIISLVFLSPSVKSKLQKNTMSYVILLFALLIALIIIMLTSDKSVSMLLYTYFPLAALFAVFFEKIAKENIQSLIIYIMLIVSVTFSFLSV